MIKIIAVLEEINMWNRPFVFSIVTFYLGKMSVYLGSMTANCKDDLDLTLLKQRKSKIQI